MSIKLNKQTYEKEEIKHKAQEAHPVRTGSAKPDWRPYFRVRRRHYCITSFNWVLRSGIFLCFSWKGPYPILHDRPEPLAEGDRYGVRLLNRSLIFKDKRCQDLEIFSIKSIKKSVAGICRYLPCELTWHLIQRYISFIRQGLFPAPILFLNRKQRQRPTVNPDKERRSHTEPYIHDIAVHDRIMFTF